MVNEISIIIPTLNEEKYLPNLLVSIAKQEFAGKLEVIVVDGYSKDRTIGIAKQLSDNIKSLKIISTKANISRQRNVGAKKAQYTTLIFLDADMVLSDNFLTSISHKIDEKSFVGIPLILPYNGSLTDYCYIIFSYLGKLLLRFYRPVITGKCIITNKRNHIKIGGFNEKAVFAEDIDYGFRSVKNGAKYHMFFGSRVYTSTRRRKEMGIVKLNFLQFRGYLDNIKSGAITDKSKYDYKFGNH